MSAAQKKGFGGFLEGLIFGARIPLLLIFVVVTVIMGWYMTQLQPNAGFKKQLPLGHEYMQTFIDYEAAYGGANRVLVALVAKDGDMFDEEYFNALSKMTDEVFFVDGVNRASVTSIFTPNVRFTEVVEDGFAGGNVIPSDFQASPESFAKVKSNIVKSGIIGRLVTEEFDGAMVWADLMENDPQTGEQLDYKAVADSLEKIRETYQNDNLEVHIIGFAKIVGDITDGVVSVVWFFGIALIITAILLFMYSGSLKLTMLPLSCSIVAVIWQLGSLKLLGFGIDPMNILTPFLIFAIGVSHGVQMINSWQNEVLHGSLEAVPGDVTKGVDSMEAARRTFRALLIPGAIALLSDTIGFMTIFFIDIQIIRELATTASIGVALIILTNLVLLPILLSMIKIRNVEAWRASHTRRESNSDGLWRALSNMTNRPVAAVAILLAAGLFVFGHFKGQEMQIGDSQQGVPELRPDSRYNTDAAIISRKFALGVDSINIIAETSAQACTEDYEAMANIDRLGWHIANIEGVQKVISLSDVAKKINTGWNEGNLRWRVLPRDNFVMRQNLQVIETSSGLLNTNCDAMPIMVFAEDHKATTINRIVNAVEDYRRQYGEGTEVLIQPGWKNVLKGEMPGWENLLNTQTVFTPKDKSELQLGEVNFRLGTGNMGVMGAVNDVVASAQLPMMVLVYLAIIILCVLTFRSIRGTICIVLPLALVSVLAYALMAWLGIGLKVNTLPVVALGVGIGVDYGIYIYSRLSLLMKQGMPLKEAYFHTMKQTGKPVIFTAFTLAIGVGTWIFSALQFQADMGKLLAFMFFLNMIGAVVLMPALARWLLRPGEKD